MLRTLYLTKRPNIKELYYTYRESFFFFERDMQVEGMHSIIGAKTPRRETTSVHNQPLF